MGTGGSGSAEGIPASHSSHSAFRGSVWLQHPPHQEISTQCDFTPEGHLAMSKDIFACHSWAGGATGIKWVGAKGAAMRKAVPIAKNDPVPDANGADIEKPWSTLNE